MKQLTFSGLESDVIGNNTAVLKEHAIAEATLVVEGLEAMRTKLGMTEDHPCVVSCAETLASLEEDIKTA